MADAAVAPIGWERALMAAEKVKERLRRATKALADAGVPYAVVGGNAVAEWVARNDPGAVRNTRDVDILIRRSDRSAERAALEAGGFVYHELLDVGMFLDGAQGRPSEAVHMLYAGEKVRPEHITPNPDVADSEPAAEFQVVSLEALVRMKLDSNRLKDKVHLLDLIGVGQLDQTWPSRMPPELAPRLQELLDNPNA
ncbi:MAG: hypothetical protein L0Y71_12400 [Gemmataceae bacterium]|nr:hypothetical protein [Gemmataceae bacterium]